MNNFQIEFAILVVDECFKLEIWEESDYERRIDLSLDFSSAAQLTIRHATGHGGF